MTPFVERLATEEEKKAGLAASEMLNRTPAELQKMAGPSQTDAGKQLTNNPYYKLGAVYSPDGQWITFAQGNDVLGFSYGK